MRTFSFILNSILLGVALAMDAFSVSAADALAEPKMSRKRMCAIAGTFCIFQTAMPLAGWFCVVTVADAFEVFRKFIPWIALLLLLYIGGKMLIDGIVSGKKGDATVEEKHISFRALMLQGIATSIDALSVGFTISELGFGRAVVECLIIGAVTFAVCIVGILIGRKFGTILSNKASVLGGIILIAIGIEIFVKALVEKGTPVWLIK